MPPPDIVNAYSAIISRTPSQSVVRAMPMSAVSAVNIALAALCAALGLFYVVSANQIAANRYAMTSLQDQSAVLTEENAALNARKSAADDPAILAAFARSHGMVEAENAAYLFEGGDVAMRP